MAAILTIRRENSTTDEFFYPTRDDAWCAAMEMILHSLETLTEPHAPAEVCQLIIKRDYPQALRRFDMAAKTKLLILRVRVVMFSEAPTFETLDIIANTKLKGTPSGQHADNRGEILDDR